MATPPNNFRSQLEVECLTMLSHLYSRGLSLPVALLETATKIEAIQQGEPAPPEIPLTEMAELHAALAHRIAPALPGTIAMLALDDARNSWRSVLGPLPTVRRLMLAAFFSMIVFMITGVADTINAHTMSKELFAVDGWDQVVLLIFLLSAAGLGSTFHALFTAQKYIADATYDTRYESSYWIRIGLGFVAGLLLAVLVPVATSPDTPTLAKPLLALLGGFSSGLVNRLLERLVDTVGSAFFGPTRQQPKEPEKTEQAGKSDLSELAAGQEASEALPKATEQPQPTNIQTGSPTLSTVRPSTP